MANRTALIKKAGKTAKSIEKCKEDLEGIEAEEDQLKEVTPAALCVKKNAIVSMNSACFHNR